MRILVIVDPHIPVPPREYGGTERMAAFFCQAMQQRGHRVDLLAAPGSANYGGRTMIHYAPLLAYPSRAFRKIWFQFLSLFAARKVDFVVNFGRLDYLWALLRTQVPVICRFDNPVTQSQINWILAQRRQKVRFIGISRSQMHGMTPQELIHVIHNPIDTNRIRFRETP